MKEEMNIDELKKSVEKGKLTIKAGKQLKELIANTKVDYDKLEKLVAESLEMLIVYFYHKRYCKQEDVIPEIIKGTKYWTGQLTKEEINQEGNNRYIIHKVNQTLDDICERVSKTYKEPSSLIAECIKKAVSHWIEVIHEENKNESENVQVL